MALHAFGPLVVVPGILEDEESWRSALAPLDLPVLVIANRGDSVAAMAASLLERAPSRFVLLGHSLGGYVALETVLATLIENARQAGAGVVAIAVRADQGRAVIELADNGPGVPPADRERIFDPFFTSRRESGGTGLGLPIARALVQGCGGSLELEDSMAGARFVVTLPLAD